MTNNSTLMYRDCRKIANLTQEQAIEHLGVEVHSLSDYETGKRKVPDDIVDKMAELYNSPLLAIWHLKTTSPLGAKYLPDVFPTCTNADAGIQSIMATRDGKKAEDAILGALESGDLSITDLPLLNEFIKATDASIGKRLSAKAYILKVINDLIKEGSREGTL